MFCDGIFKETGDPPILPVNFYYIELVWLLRASGELGSREKDYVKLKLVDTR